MADITVTAANVIAGAGASTRQVTAGETITAGQVVYKDTSAGDKYKLADADAVGTAAGGGIALNGASNGQPLTIITGGNLNPGATVTTGEVYVVSTTAGGIAPLVDLLTGDFVTVLGTATTTSNINIQIQVSGVAEP
jgi:hypothetical protein